MDDRGKEGRVEVTTMIFRSNFYEVKPYRCLRCDKWFRPGNVACAAWHADGHCHYGDVEVEPDPDPKGEMIA